jgi:hypothetical protein
MGCEHQRGRRLQPLRGVSLDGLEAVSHHASR